MDGRACSACRHGSGCAGCAFGKVFGAEKMKLTRRQLVVAAAGSAVAVKTRAQTPPVSVPDSVKAAQDPARAARDSVQRNGDDLAKFDIPMSTEPEFPLKAAR